MIKLIFVLIISYISSSAACSCFLPIGWQDESYCRSTFAGTFKVTGPGYDCGDNPDERVCYPIVVLDQMRGPPVLVTRAETHFQSSMCGTTLSVGHTYFVATYPGESNNIGVGLCMLLEDWTDLSCKEIKKKKKHYKQLSCGDEPTVPQEPECVRTTNSFDLNYLLCRLRKLTKLLKLRSCEKCNKCD